MARVGIPHSLQIADTDFVVCDVETTGLQPERNRITEVALLRIRGGCIVDRYSSLINPKQFISPEITRLTGISNDMVYTAPLADEVMPLVRRFIGDAVFVAHNVQFDRRFIDSSLHRIGSDTLISPNLCTARLARRLVPEKSRSTLAAVAARYGITIRSRHRAAGDAEATAKVLLIMLSTLEEEFDITETGELLSFQHRRIYAITGAPKYYSRLREQLDELPHSPGVYAFHDRRGGILYVGKSKDLKKRVSSYFFHNIGHTGKIRRLVRAVHGITWTETETELSALLAESRMIKQHQPRFNSRLKNSRSYPFIRIDTNDTWPTISWRYEICDDNAEYFGPFRSRFAVEEAISDIHTLFRLRECEGRITPDANSAACMYLDIKRCLAPCAALVDVHEYAREVEDVVLFLQGKHDDMIDRFRMRMHEKAEKLDFEGASMLRDRIRTLERIIRQQSLMVHSVRRQNLVIVTLARRRYVEVHCIKAGLPAAQKLIEQHSWSEAELECMLREVYVVSAKDENFNPSVQHIDEMRIIATWRLTRSEESSIVDLDPFPGIQEAMRRLAQAIECCGAEAADTAVTT